MKFYNCMTAPLKIIFMGTPDFAVPALRNLIANPKFQVIAVYTQPPRPKGRGQAVLLSPVHATAEEHEIPVLTPASFKKDPAAIEHFKAIGADVGVIAAYGLILPKAVLEAPKFGCLNIHASLLPRWRGASPIQRAIEHGDLQSGITIMQMDEGLDTGAMLLKRAVTLHATTTASSLHDELSALGSVMIEEVLEGLCAGRVFHPEPQDSSLATYAALLKKEDGRIDWSRPASEIGRHVRAFNPWPGTFTLNAQGKRLRILEGEVSPQTSTGEVGSLLTKSGDIACGEGTAYRILKLQPDSGKAMSIGEALSGHHLTVGEQLV